MPVPAILNLDAVVITSSEQSKPYQRANHVIGVEALDQSFHKGLGCDDTDFLVPDVWVTRGANELSNFERG